MSSRAVSTVSESDVWKTDRTVGCISLLMWGGTMVRVWGQLTPGENLQSVSAMVAMFVVVVAWPTWFRAHYLRWRVPAIAFLRTYLIALPFNFSVGVFDAIAPDVDHSRLAVVANLFQLFMAIRVALLTFTSLGWQLPFRLHMVLQTLNCCIFVRFGMHNYCRSKLLTSPELQATADALHTAMSFVAAVFVPSATVLVPSGQYAQLVSFLLFTWAIMGWLLPTLLLLPEAPAARPHGSRVAWALENWLRQLLPAKQAAARRAQQAHLPAAATCTLHWWAVLLVTWGVCSTIAPLFGNPRAPAV